MLAVTIAALALGTGDFTLTRTELNDLNEARSIGRDFGNTLDKLILREGVPVLRARIPASELNLVDLWFERVVRTPVRPAMAARAWVGNRTKDFEHEYIDLKWKAGGRSILWSDFEGNLAALVRMGADDALMRTPEDAKELLPGLMAQLFDLPRGIPPYTLFITKTELPSGAIALSGYAALVKEQRGEIGIPFELAKDQSWASNIQVCVVDRLVSFRFSRAFGSGGGQGARPEPYRRPNSRFNPPKPDGG